MLLLCCLNHRSIFSYKNKVIFFIFGLIFSTLTLGTTTSLLAQTQEDKLTNKNNQEKIYNSTLVKTLELDKEIEQKMSSEDKHTYKIETIKGQYLHIEIEQKGIDIIKKILNPKFEEIIEFNSFKGNQGIDPLFLVAEETGVYSVELYSPEKEVVGSYKIKIIEMRDAKPQDIEYVNTYITAYKSFIEAYKLDQQNTKDSLEKAIKGYQKALLLYEKCGNTEGEVYIAYFLGVALIKSGENQKALECLSKSLPGWKKINEASGEANTLQVIGDIYNFLGDNNKALEYFNQAIEVISKTGNLSIEANIDFNISKIYNDIGDNQKALELLGKTLKLYNNLQDSLGMADTITFIGKVYSDLGDNQKALENFNKALPLYTDTKNLSGKARVYNAIGAIYVYLVKYEYALEFFNKALEIRSSLGEQVEESETLINMAGAYIYEGNNNEALKCLDRASTIQKELEDPNSQSAIFDNIGVIYRNKKEYQKALMFLTKSLEIRRSIGNPSKQALTLTNIGLVYSAKSEDKKALEAFNEALELHKIVGNKIGEAITLSCIAINKRKTNELDQALEKIQESITIIESLRVKIKTEDLRTSYFSSVQEQYRFYVDLLMQLHKQNPKAGYDAKALIVSENRRARSLLDLIKESKIDINKGVDPKLLQQKYDLEKKYNEKTHKLLKNRNKPKQDQSQEEIILIEKESEEIYRQLQEIEVKIKNSCPSYSTLNKPNSISLEQIQRDILDKDTLLLEYSLGETHSYLWLVSSTSIKSYELPKQTIITKVTKDLYNSLSAGLVFLPKGEEKQAKQEYIRLASNLSDLILSPVANKLDKKRLLVVADGILNFIPFSTLPEPHTKKMENTIKPFLPLIFNHVVVSEPSISVLGLLKQQNFDENLITKTIGLFGDPIFGYDDERIKAKLSKKEANETSIDTRNSLDTIDSPISDFLYQQKRFKLGDQLARLYFTGEEVKNIARLLPSDKSRFWVGFNANLENVVNQDLTQYQYIHFATHGLINNEKPRLTALVLSLIDNEGKEKQGFLTLNEIFNLNLNARMVTLSACQTALGKQVDGEGLVGLTRAFLYAGTKSLTVSLWNVNDKSTAELMVRFYKEIFENNLPPSEALRQAQLSIMKEPQWQLPYYWAAFQLQGTW